MQLYTAGYAKRRLAHTLRSGAIRRRTYSSSRARYARNGIFA